MLNFLLFCLVPVLLNYNYHYFILKVLHSYIRLYYYYDYDYCCCYFAPFELFFDYFYSFYFLIQFLDIENFSFKYTLQLVVYHLHLNLRILLDNFHIKLLLINFLFGYNFIILQKCIIKILKSIQFLFLNLYFWLYYHFQYS